MQKFTKLIIYLHDLQRDLGHDLAVAADKRQKKAVLLNAKYEVVKEIADKALEILNEDYKVKELLEEKTKKFKIVK